MITVLIPTAKRPDLLANALRSVAEQTALRQITEIIVSESAGDSRSGGVCRQFPNLPITYILRDPQMHMTEHFSALKKAKWSGELTAILHDDDWWTPDHIDKAIEALRSHPKANAYCCNSYYVANENALLQCGTNLAFWFGGDYPSLKATWELDQAHVFLGLLVVTPAAYSSMVIRAESLREAATVYDTDNRWDAERMLLFELSTRGTIVYSPFPYAFYRVHPQQLTHSYTTEYCNKQMERTTEWIVRNAGITWAETGDKFYKRFIKCPKEARVQLRLNVMKPHCLPFLAKQVDRSSELSKLYRRLRAKGVIKNVLRQLLPPFLLKRGKQLHKTLTKTNSSHEN